VSVPAKELEKLKQQLVESEKARRIAESRSVVDEIVGLRNKIGELQKALNESESRYNDLAKTREDLSRRLIDAESRAALAGAKMASAASVAELPGRISHAGTIGTACPFCKTQINVEFFKEKIDLPDGRSIEGFFAKCSACMMQFPVKQ